MEFELVYEDLTVQYISHYFLGNPLSQKWKKILQVIMNISVQSQ